MTRECESVYMIANPRAGRKHSKQQWMQAVSHAACVWEETQREGHAESLAYEASLRGYRWIIAVGGDGTIHEVLNGMLRNPDNQSILGLLPAGTANDYAAAFPDGGRTVVGNRPGIGDGLRVDVGCLRWSDGYRYFANVAGIGFSGEVASRARGMLRVPARLRYTLALLRQLGPGYGPQAMHVALDDGPMTETETLLMSAAIGKREGSYPLHGRADISDGLFEFLRLGRLSRRELARYFPAMLRGILPTDHPQVHQSQCRRIEVVSSAPVAIHLDGEFPRGAHREVFTRFSLKTIPLALRVTLVSTRSTPGSPP